MPDISTAELLAENERLHARVAHLEHVLATTQTQTYLSALRDTTHTLMSQLDLDDLFLSIIQRAASMENAEHAYFYVLEKDNLTMRCRAALGVFEPYIGQVMSLKEGLTGRVWGSGEIMLVESYDDWPDRHPDIPKSEFGSVVGLPLQSEGQIIGVVGLAFSDLQRRFSQSDLEILQAFADLSAIVLQNAQIHESLRASERLVQKVADTLPDILYVQDLKVGRSIYSNKPRRSALGYEQDELKKLNRSSTPLVIHPDDVPRVAAHGKNAPNWTDDTIASLEYRMMHADGHWRWFRTRETIFQRDAEGIPTQLLGIAQDITETKNAEDALRESEQRFRALIEMVDVIVFIYKKDGISYINPTVERITGYTAETLLGNKFWKIIHPDYLQPLMEQNRHFIETGQGVLRQEVPLITSDKTVLWLDLSQMVVNLDGEEAVLGTAIDITERKQGETDAFVLQLEKERIRLLAEFVQSMSHDFRTPLTTINTSL
ncbi:MAG: PAS domain S-box protein, partial [Chitinophagaceae bacterium]|nr:PAS domain S-box protein [Anaerolineae bacterium]